MKVFYSDPFSFPLPEGHRFPREKYRLLRQAVEGAGLVPPQDLILAPPATDKEILRAHSADYLTRLQAGELEAKEQRRIGLPWSPELVERARRSAGGTLAACRAALVDGLAVNLAGGTHHAFRGHGQGFCMLNDSIIAIRTLQAEHRIQRAIVVDCDVHQGNGTADLAAGDDSIYTFSIHSESNFPLFKVQSDLDIGLDDGIGDEAYLHALEGGLQQALAEIQADLVLYLAGADPFEGDLLGKLALSKEGLARRDRLVLTRCLKERLPIAVMMAGGYGRYIEDTVSIHLQTVRIAAELSFSQKR